MPERMLFNKYHGDAPSDAVNIMRPGKWGNPYPIGKNRTREQAIEDYEKLWLPHRKDLEELRGKRLFCCCYPKPCHGDAILRRLKETENG